MLNPGDVVAGYRIERRLGAGGMGAVYLAADPNLPRYDALKVLSAELSGNPDFRARFHREAEVAARLDHPNIVSVYARGETADHQLWIAMQFVDGTDAEAAQRTGTMTPARAVHIIGEVAKALDYAHAHAVVHRDVKPANFLLSGPPGPAERVLLGDFGIARALDDVRLTATGSVLATVAFAAPEVLSGAAFDDRADIYSLGCALFTLLTGALPFVATNGLAAAVIMAHLHEPPPRATARIPGLPRALDDVIAVAMAKDPAARFPSAGALAEAARAALFKPGARLALPRPPRRPGTWRRRGLIAAAAAAVLAASAGGFALAGHRGPAAPADPLAAAADEPPAQDGGASAPAGTPATDVAPTALRSILLTADQLPGNQGPDRVVLETDGSAPLDDGGTLDNGDCVGAWSPAQRYVYAAAGYTGIAVQTLRAINQRSFTDGVVQAALAFPSRERAVASLQLQQKQWGLCADKTVTVTVAGAEPAAWQFGRPTTIPGALRLDSHQRDGTAGCQHVLAVRGNVLLDIRACRPAGPVNAAAVLAATSAKVPRQ